MDERTQKIGNWTVEAQERRRTIGQRAFGQFKPNSVREGLIWQEVDNLFPYMCTNCRREFPGGLRYVAQRWDRRSHHKADYCECVDCRSGIDPFKRLAPKLAERRTELD